MMVVIDMVYLYFTLFLFFKQCAERDINSKRIKISLQHYYRLLLLKLFVDKNSEVDDQVNKIAKNLNDMIFSTTIGLQIFFCPFFLQRYNSSTHRISLNLWKNQNTINENATSQRVPFLGFKWYDALVPNWYGILVSWLIIYCTPPVRYYSIVLEVCK